MALSSLSLASLALLVLTSLCVAQKPLFTWDGPREKLCEACTEAVSQLAVLISDPDVMNESVAVLEGTICSQLPGDLHQQCVAAVEEYVPLVFAELQEHLSVEAICVKATHLCPLESITQGAKGPEDCLACRLVVKLLKKHLDNPKTQARIEKYLEERCARISNSTRAAKCTDAVDKYLPLIFANIDVILNEKKLCKEAGLCPVIEQGIVASA